ncbi:hypothetical protein KR018_005599 [Drosophila ironensis]|nr:hypothetical protein KR018_005599 [Drosophila ironensis]
MACCGCFEMSEERQGRLTHEAIEEKLRWEKKQACRELKLLILGTGEAGKSTFIRQMQIIHGNGFTATERLKYIQMIHQNVFTAMQGLIKEMEQLNIPYDSAENKHRRSKFEHPQYYAHLVRDYDENVLTDPYLSALKILWSDLGIQNCCARGRDYHLPESAKHYLNDLDRLADGNYVPTDEDILLVRWPTNGIREYSFRADGLHYRMIDVGGQRTERRKWIHCFECVTSIIFISAISEFGQKLKESEDVSRIDESKSLFWMLISLHWFKDASIILFLNKIDLFEKRVLSENFAEYFPDYTGPLRNAEAARDFMLQKILPPNEEQKMKIYWHFTNATNTKNIKVVFAAVRHAVLEKTIKDCPMF